MDSFDLGSFFDMTFPSFPAAPPAMESSFAGSAAMSEETGSPVKKLRYDGDSSEMRSGGSALELAHELAFDPFMLLLMPYLGGYEYFGGHFAAEAVQQDVNNDMMNGVSLWSFDDFPVDGAVF
jgi:EREBP-like factor